VTYLQNLMLRFPELTVMVMGLIILAALAARKLSLRRKAAKTALEGRPPETPALQQ
jgi:hypothetical protein